MVGTEWIVVGVLVFVLFGAKKLPEVARSFGSSIVEFKKGMKEEPEQKTEEGKEQEPAGGKS